MIFRLKKNDFPISDKFEQATIAAVDIRFDYGGNCEEHLVALDEIFCVSFVVQIYAQIYLTPAIYLMMQFLHIDLRK